MNPDNLNLSPVELKRMMVMETPNIQPGPYVSAGTVNSNQFINPQYSNKIVNTAAANYANSSLADWERDLLEETKPKERETETMLEKLIKLYTAYMINDVRSPMPHLAGPPGVGKSSTVEQLAKLLGVNLHIVNVSRLSPLELEGVQMPVGNVDKLDEYRLHLLTSTLWTQLKEGDIVLLDEFLRGFPEVYNGLLDIITSRQVAGYTLPQVFFVAASNSVAAYDKALEDRLLHIPVEDIRKSKRALRRTKELFVNECGLLPDIVDSIELDDLIKGEVQPMYEVLDRFKNRSSSGGALSTTGHSLRNLIGQVQLREVRIQNLKEVISINNVKALSDNKPQYVVLLDGKNPPPKYRPAAEKLVGNTKLTSIQARNIELNLHLIKMEKARKSTTEGEEIQDEDIFA